jgi:hypothetical protein
MLVLRKLEECNYTPFTIRGRRCPEFGFLVKSPPIIREPKESKFDGLFQCEQCSLISLLRYPDDATLAYLYEGEGIWQLHSQKEAQIPNERLRKKIVRLLDSKTGSLYEVGASRGIFLAYMKRHGWRVAGIEPAPKAVKYAREIFGLELEQAFFDPDCLWCESLLARSRKGILITEALLHFNFTFFWREDYGNG